MQDTCRSCNKAQFEADRTKEPGLSSGNAILLLRKVTALSEAYCSCVLPAAFDLELIYPLAGRLCGHNLSASALSYTIFVSYICFEFSTRTHSGRPQFMKMGSTKALSGRPSYLLS